jgi:hypothetical protein
LPACSATRSPAAWASAGRRSPDGAERHPGGALQSRREWRPCGMPDSGACIRARDQCSGYSADAFGRSARVLACSPVPNAKRCRRPAYRCRPAPTIVKARLRTRQQKSG